MKYILPIILSLFYATIFGQNIEERVIKIDTLNLDTFNEKNVVIYKIGNANVCMSAEKYLTKIIYYQNHFKNIVSEIRKKDEGYEFYNKTYKFLDSIKSALEYGMKNNDTIRISNSLFEKAGLIALVDLNEYIDNADCAIFDLSGNRKYTIIRKTVKQISEQPDYTTQRKDYFLGTEITEFFSALVRINVN